MPDIKRTIKFRAWDNKNKEMFSVTQMSFGINPWVLDTHDGNEAVFDFTLMQYTGLLDKNGVEIYEGDVVLWASMATSVGFENGGFTLTDYDRGERGVGKKLHTVYANLDHLEVIGNIWEHTELLTPKQEI